MVSLRLISGDRVYPRVCGGTGHSTDSNKPTRGLSPRVRGNPRPWYGIGGRKWSIPACAGEPRAIAETKHMRKVYPRVCGYFQHALVI